MTTRWSLGTLPIGHCDSELMLVVVVLLTWQQLWQLVVQLHQSTPAHRTGSLDPADLLTQLRSSEGGPNLTLMKE